MLFDTFAFLLQNVRLYLAPRTTKKLKDVYTASQKMSSSQFDVHLILFNRAITLEY